MWIKPGDWSFDDAQQHIFFDVLGEGAIRFWKGSDSINCFMVKAPDVTDPGHFEDKYPGMAQAAYDSQQHAGDWVQFFLIWKMGETMAYYRGYHTPVVHEGRTYYVHRTLHFHSETPSPGKLSHVRIGDFGGNPGRNASTFIDEVYIYDRALTFEECEWANQHARDRRPGMDIPSTFAAPTVKVVPDPDNKTLVVEVDSGDRTGNFAGTARLEPTSGTQPAPIVQKEGRFGEGVIPYTDLPQGDYQVISEITTRDGKPVTTVTAKLVVPGPPVWLEEKVGVSDTPPPPWTPVRLRGDRLRVWGREYSLGAFGLPRRITTQHRQILAGPVEMRFASGGQPVAWKHSAVRLVKQTAAQVVRSGESSSSLGTMTWQVTGEFDGFLLYDFELVPAAGATCGLLELRVPIRKDSALLLYQGSGPSQRGILRAEPGVAVQAGFGRYWWIGTDEFGLCGATEHPDANLDAAADAFRIVREENGDVTVVYLFAGKPVVLNEPWKLRWVLQATPTKPLPADWRTWRDWARGGDKGAPHPVRLVVASPWPTVAQFRHFSFPEAKDQNWYRSYVADWHKKGAIVLPYSQVITLSPGMPEVDFYWREWHNPLGELQVMGGGMQYVSARFVPSYIDFMTWKHRELARQQGHDGLYVDFAGVYGAFLALEHGVGYTRDGKEHRAEFPIVSVREMWKRLYTMFKELNPNSVIVGHNSTAAHAPVLAFCDVWLNGEGNWRGQLRDNYLDVLPLDELRAEFRAQAHGGVPWWLPQWKYQAELEDKDVASRFPADYVTVSMRGKPREVSVEKGHHQLGIGLLLDIGFWAIDGINGQAVRDCWAVQDKFGIADAAFLGYWNNADLIGGQTDAIKASAYRKPNGGALVVVYNVTREPRTANLAVAWKKLKGQRALEVVDAYTEAPVEVKGGSVTVDVPPLNYRLLWVR